MVSFNGPVVYDAGALLAAERGDDRMRALHRRFLLHGISPDVPSPVLTQAWRDGSRQVGLTRLLKGCAVLPTDEEVAKHAGVLLRMSRTCDAVDAIVVATAMKYAATVVTSDPKDLQQISDAAAFHLGLVEV
ncbi:type II toxin-antitoxin system VapC family toxin [Actinophytocola sp.]|uniref:type II toxin-antitoxin system VapC family toxin n=1 Tax=Actinophytocola sp. TaxID=1872138 RepID=UPI00389A6EE2